MLAGHFRISSNAKCYKPRLVYGIYGSKISIMNGMVDPWKRGMRGSLLLIQKPTDRIVRPHQDGTTIVM